MSDTSNTYSTVINYDDIDLANPSRYGVISKGWLCRVLIIVPFNGRPYIVHYPPPNLMNCPVFRKLKEGNLYNMPVSFGSARRMDVPTSKSPPRKDRQRGSYYCFTDCKSERGHPGRADVLTFDYVTGDGRFLPIESNVSYTYCDPINPEILGK